MFYTPVCKLERGNINLVTYIHRNSLKAAESMFPGALCGYLVHYQVMILNAHPIIPISLHLKGYSSYTCLQIYLDFG